MNNQAAQTMPELLPCPFCGHHIPEFRARIKGDPKWHVIKCPDCPCKCEYCSSTEEQAVASWNRRTAISQTAVVPDVLFDGYAVYQGMTDEARARINAGGVSDVLDSVVRLIRAQGAPAASGGESAASLSSNPNPVTPSLSSESAASVSERDRIVAMLVEVARAAHYAMDDCGDLLLTEDGAEKLSNALDALDELPEIDDGYVRDGWLRAKDHLAALEQALTQQRVCATCGGRGEIGGHVGQTAETFDYVTEPCPECTTPQPSADAVRELVKRWRDEAGQLLEDHGGDRAAVCVADAMRSMTDELESLLSGGSHA